MFLAHIEKIRKPGNEAPDIYTYSYLSILCSTDCQGSISQQTSIIDAHALSTSHLYTSTHTYPYQVQAFSGTNTIINNLRWPRRAMSITNFKISNYQFRFFLLLISNSDISHFQIGVFSSIFPISNLEFSYHPI